MSPKIKTAGGGQAKGTADAFNNFLLTQLQSGNLANVFNQTLSGDNNPAQGFNPLTYQVPNFQNTVDANDPLFAARQAQLDRDTQMGLANMRTRFGAMGRGSNAAMAESAFLSQANPANMLAMNDLANSMREQNRADTGLQAQDVLARMGMAMQGNQAGMANRMQGLNMLFGGLQQANQLGTPQAQMFMQPSGFSQAMGAVAGLAPFAMAPFTGGASLGMAGTMPDLNFWRGITGQGWTNPAASPNTQMNPNWNPNWTPQTGMFR